jgi:hypothetical protein
MTRNLKVFAAFSLGWSVAFFAVLNWGTEASSERWPYIVAAAAAYGTGFALVGRWLGKHDDQSKVRYSLEHAYSATSNLISAGAGSLWIGLFRPQESWFLAVYLPLVLALAWLGFRSYQRSIKGIKSDQLFK